MKKLFTLIAAATLGATALSYAADSVSILNVSYDPTRELYQNFNKAFVAHWKAETGQDVEIKQSHGGSGKQALAVLNGIPANVVTLGIPYDIASLEKKGLVAKDWAQQFPNKSEPYTSVIVFLVRKDNPKHIKDWSDLVRSDVKVVTPNPKTSAGGRWSFLGAWGYALAKNHDDEAKAKQFIAALYKNVPVLDSGARGSTTTFAERGIGDVLIAWENEALLAKKEDGSKFDIVYPPLTVIGEPPVALVEKNDANPEVRKVAEAYLKYLYTPEGQKIAAENFYRPIDEKVAAQFAAQFPKVQTWSASEKWGGDWLKLHQKFFGDGGVFDQIYTKN